MKKRLGLNLAIVICCLFGFLLAPAAAIAKKPIILKLVIATPEGDWPQTYRDKEMANRFNERAKGRYQIDVHTGGAIAQLPEFFNAVRIGVAEMQFSNWGMFSFMDPTLGLLELPFLLDGNEATSEATKQMLPIFDDLLQNKFNAKGLAMMTTGGLGMWSQEPIRTLDDMKGLLTASVSPMSSMMIGKLGASPMTINFPDIYESLQKRIVDASTQSSHGGVVFSFYEACPHFTAFFGMQAIAGYTINLDVWKKMPADIKQILQEETQTAANWMNNIVLTELADFDLNVFEKKGVDVYYVPSREREKWAGLFRASNDAELNKYGSLGRQLKEIVDTANKKYPYRADKSSL